MPFLEGPFQFTGKLDMLSAYRMRGVDGIVIRRKGGPSADKIKNSPRCENMRRTMTEFGGCSRLGSYVRMAMHPVKQLSDFNFGSDINSVMRQVQLRDEEFGAWGRRKIILSEHPRMLEGFLTTMKAPSFDSIVRTPVYYTMDRVNRSARVEIPELLRDINYFPQNNHAMFRLTITLGIVPDLRYDAAEKEYLPAKWYGPACYAQAVSTEWSPSLEGMGSTTLDIAMDMLPPEDGWTLMLAIGIQYGAFRENGKIAEVKRFGAAKILALRGKDGTTGGDVGSGEVREDEAVILEDVVMASEDAVKHEPEAEVYRGPEVRYVYTMKTENIVYSYTIHTAQMPAQNQSVASVDGFEENFGDDGVIVPGTGVNFKDFEFQGPGRKRDEVVTVGMPYFRHVETLSRAPVFEVQNAQGLVVPVDLQFFDAGVVAVQALAFYVAVGNDNLHDARGVGWKGK